MSASALRSWRALRAYRCPAPTQSRSPRIVARRRESLGWRASTGPQRRSVTPHRNRSRTRTRRSSAQGRPRIAADRACTLRGISGGSSLVHSIDDAERDEDERQPDRPREISPQPDLVGDLCGSYPAAANPKSPGWLTAREHSHPHRCDQNRGQGEYSTDDEDHCNRLCVTTGVGAAR